VQAKARMAALPDGSKGEAIPTTCDLVKACVDSGAEAVVLIPPYDVPRYGPYPRTVSGARPALPRASGAFSSALSESPAAAPFPPGRRC
jgi:hypothetical protein